MKKGVFFAIVSIVVLPFSSLLHTFGIAGIPEAPSPMAGVLAHFDASPWPQRSDTAIPRSPQKAFLLSVDKAVFACSEDACDHYFRQCGLDIDYTLYSGQIKTSENEAVIVCRAKIVYQTKGGYHLNSEAGPETSHHALKHKAEHSSQLSLHFHFSEYEQVTEVQLDKFECRVHPGNYVSGVTESLID